MTGMPADASSSTCGSTRAPPSSFTAWAPHSFMNRAAVSSACVRRALVGPERQVGHDHRARRPAHDAAHERHELVDRDRDRGVVAVDDHRGRVADEQHGDPGLVEHPRGEGVVRRDHRPLLAARLGLGEVAHGDASTGGGAAVQGLGSVRGRAGHETSNDSSPRGGVPVRDPWSHGPASAPSTRRRRISKRYGCVSLLTELGSPASGRAHPETTTTAPVWSPTMADRSPHHRIGGLAREHRVAQPAPLEDPRRARREPRRRRPRQHGPQRRAQDDPGGPRRHAEPAHLGDQRLHAGLRLAAVHVGRARRPVRPQAHPHHRAHAVRAGLGAHRVRLQPRTS